jgi:hypothetical protein
MSGLLTARCSPCPPAACSCLKKSATCEDCRDRRRSLQGAGYQQCGCCADLLCANNSTNTGSVCAGPPSEPGLGEITDTEVVPDAYTLTIPVIPSNDTGAVGIGEFWACCAPVLCPGLGLA